MTLLEKIKYLCSQQGLNISKLEKQAGLKPKSINKWDQSSPSVDKVLKVADVLSVSVEELLNVGTPEFQKTQTALLTIYKNSPELYRIIASGLENEKPATESDGQEEKEEKIDISVLSKDQRKLIDDVLKLSDQETSALLTMTETLLSGR